MEGIAGGGGAVAEGAKASSGDIPAEYCKSCSAYRCISSMGMLSLGTKTRIDDR